MNKISKCKINKQEAEIESPWRAPRSEGKYWVALPPFMTHGSCGNLCQWLTKVLVKCFVKYKKYYSFHSHWYF